MNKLTFSLTLSLLIVSILGSSQASAKNIKVEIGRIDNSVEIIIPSSDATLDHEYQCRDSDQAVYIRTKSSKIQPACVNYGSLDSTVTPLAEGITFITLEVKYKDAVLDVDNKKIR